MVLASPREDRMNRMTGSVQCALATACFVLFLASATQAQENTRVRVVRLSFTEGTVTIQRPNAEEWSLAPVNTPIQEGFKVATAKDGFAEIQFENALSTVRLGELSEVEFTQLQVSPEGTHLNRLTLDRGYATFHATPSSGDVYEVRVADATLIPNGKAEFRLDVDQGAVRAEVFKGEVEFGGSEGSETLSKNMVLEFTPVSTDPYQIGQGIATDDWDDWVKQRDEVIASAAVAPSGEYASDTSTYGWSDLNAYGTWNTVPGYGWAWFPNVSSGWSPYCTGRWTWYPSLGYTWIGGEPWGWLPYHTGKWFFDAGPGWFWMPGGGFAIWSPALVSWYQGPGWVGWTPRNVPVHGFPNWHAGRTGITVVATDVVREGKPVTPHNLYSEDFNLSQGRLVEKPEITPGHLALLPGDPVAHPPFTTGHVFRGSPQRATRPAGQRTSIAGSAPSRPGFSTARTAPRTTGFAHVSATGPQDGRMTPTSSQGWTRVQQGAAAGSRSAGGMSGTWIGRSNAGGVSGSNHNTGGAPGGGTGAGHASSGGASSAAHR